MVCAAGAVRSGYRQVRRFLEGKAWVAQVERQGCELILSSQWPDKVGKGLMFVSLDVSVLDALRAELPASLATAPVISPAS